MKLVRVYSRQRIASANALGQIQWIQSSPQNGLLHKVSDLASLVAKNLKLTDCRSCFPWQRDKRSMWSSHSIFPSLGET